MKTRITLLLATLIGLAFTAQAQRGFSFQGYARDASGAALAGQVVNIEFNLIRIATGSTDYTETTTVTTDAFGVFSTVIGEGDASFAGIDFLSFDYRLDVSIEGVLISSRRLDAVPYAKAAEKSGNGVPPGTILPFGGPVANVPEGYVACDGNAYNGSPGSIYEDLYNAIGNAWGGSGVNFNVPDLRGYFIRGWAGSETTNADPDFTSRAGGEPTDKIGSYQNDEFREHLHEIDLTTSTNGAHSHNIQSEGGSNVGGGNDDIVIDNDNNGAGFNRSTTSDGNHSHTVQGDSKVVGGAETRPKNAYVLYIIKL